MMLLQPLENMTPTKPYDPSELTGAFRELAAAVKSIPTSVTFHWDVGMNTLACVGIVSAALMFLGLTIACAIVLCRRPQA